MKLDFRTQFSGERAGDRGLYFVGGGCSRQGETGADRPSTSFVIWRLESGGSLHFPVHSGGCAPGANGGELHFLTVAEGAGLLARQLRSVVPEPVHSALHSFRTP